MHFLYTPGKKGNAIFSLVSITSQYEINKHMKTLKNPFEE